MLYKVFDFADKEVHEVMVPRPQVVAIKADLPSEEALAALLESPYTRYPVYRDSLDEVIGVLHVRDLFTALHDRGIAEVELEQLASARLHRPGDEGSRRAARRVPQAEPAHGRRRRRVRRDAGDRHARGPAGGDRRRDRGRVRPSGRVGRADRRHPHPNRRHVPDRRLQRAVRDRDRDRGLPHDGRLRLRRCSAARPRSGTRSRRTDSSSTSSRSRARGSSGSRWSSTSRARDAETRAVAATPPRTPRMPAGRWGSASTSVTSPSRIVKRRSWSMSSVRPSRSPKAR